MENRIVERLETTPFGEMEEIENGLYRMDITGFRENEARLKESEADRDSLVFGDADGIVPAIICHDGESGLLACTEMVFRKYGFEEIHNWEWDGAYSLYDVKELFQEHKFYAEWFENEDIDFLMNLLDEGCVVMCTVNDLVINVPELADVPGLGASHPVIVAGMDFTNPANPKVILNDPCAEGGRRVCDLPTFVCAWEKGNNFIMVVGKETWKERMNAI